MESTQQPRDVMKHPRSPGTATSALDVAVGASMLAAQTAASVVRRARPVMEPLARAALDPPIVPEPLRPGRWLRALARRGEAERNDSVQDFSRLLDALVPLVAEAALERADLTTLVKRYVDLDSVVESVDLDAAAKRIDVDAVVAQADLDAAAARIDVDAVARRLDVDAVLDRLDLTAVVLDRVDLEVLVQAVLDKIDLPSLATEVIDAVDLPEIIRESTGSMASDTVRGARMQGIAADETVGRIRDRLLLRRNHGPGKGGQPSPPGPPSPEPAEQPGIPAQPTRGW